MARPRAIADEVILARVRGALLEHGARASLDELAVAAGMSAPGLLRRFKSRDGLVVKSLELPGPPPWVALLDKGPDERSLEAQLTDIVVALDAFFAEMMPRLTALRECGCAPSGAGPRRGRAALRAFMARARDRGAIGAQVDIDAAAHLVFGAVFARAFFHHVVEQRAPRRATPEQIRAVVDLCTAALRPASKARPPRARGARPTSRRAQRTPRGHS
jgi:AcrR family transcriptional regulator